MALKMPKIKPPTFRPPKMPAAPKFRLPAAPKIKLPPMPKLPKWNWDPLGLKAKARKALLILLAIAIIVVIIYLVWVYYIQPKLISRTLQATGPIEATIPGYGGVKIGGPGGQSPPGAGSL